MSKGKLENERQPDTSSVISQAHLRLACGIGALFVFTASFVLYLFTLAPTVTLVDSGELILAARTFGVAHPPGFPLYILLAHAASLLPLGNAAVRIHLASALFAALASAAMTLLVTEAMLAIAINRIHDKTKRRSGKKSLQPLKALKSESELSSNSVFIIAPAIVAGLLFAFSRTLWAYATIAEVYTLNSLLIVMIFWLTLRWRRTCLGYSSKQDENGDGNLHIAAFLFGLALGVHHVTVGLMLPALATLVLATEGIRFFTSKRVVYATLASFAGLSVYIYLPLAASQSPLMNWGDPRTLERFWWHITARQYQVFWDFSIGRLSEFLRLASREFGSPWLPFALGLAVAGFLYLFRREKSLLICLALIIFADIAYCLCYEIAEDKDAYYLPAFIGLTIAASLGMRWIIEIIQRTKLPKVAAPICTAVFLIIIPLVALAGNFAFNDRSRYFIAQDYVANILKSVEPRGMLLTTDWQVYSPSLYVREVEKQRKDAIIININQLRRSWYYDYLNQAYPELTQKSRDKIDIFLQDLRAWEHNPEAYNNSPSLQQRINSRFYEMIMSFISNQINDAPVYVTSEIAANRGGQDAELTNTLIEKYHLIPLGLILRVSEENNVNTVSDPLIVTRGLSDGTLMFDDDDVVKKKILPVYLNMAMNSGYYFALQGNHARAIEHFRQALRLDPTFEPAKKALAASRNILSKQSAK